MRNLLASIPAAVAAAALACASPEPIPPGTSRVAGEVRLVPRSGASAAGGAYGDRRYRDAELVDYSRPGFAVVYLVAGDPPAEELEVTIRSSRVGVAFDPRRAAVGAAGRIVVRNESDAAHIVSHPATGRVVEVEPGGAVELAIDGPGEQHLYLLDVPATTATVFAAPGPYAVVRSSGRFALSGLEPGRRTLHAWHPRLPPVSRAVELVADASVDVDLELGVGLADGADDAD